MNNHIARLLDGLGMTYSMRVEIGIERPRASRLDVGGILPYLNPNMLAQVDTLIQRFQQILADGSKGMMTNLKTSQEQYRTLRQYLKDGDGEPQPTFKDTPGCAAQRERVWAIKGIASASQATSSSQAAQDQPPPAPK